MIMTCNKSFNLLLGENDFLEIHKGFICEIKTTDKYCGNLILPESNYIGDRKCPVMLKIPILIIPERYLVNFN